MMQLSASLKSYYYYLIAIKYITRQPRHYIFIKINRFSCIIYASMLQNCIQHRHQSDMVNFIVVWHSRISRGRRICMTTTLKQQVVSWKKEKQHVTNLVWRVFFSLDIWFINKRHWLSLVVSWELWEIRN